MPAGALVGIVRPALQSCGRERVDDAMASGRGQVVSGSRQSRGSPEQSADWVGEDTWTFMPCRLSAAIRSIDSRVPSRITNVFVRAVPITWARVGSANGQDFDGLVYVPVDGRNADSEASGKLGVGVAAPQMGQGDQGLAAGCADRIRARRQCGTPRQTPHPPARRQPPRRMAGPDPAPVQPALRGVRPQPAQAPPHTARSPGRGPPRTAHRRGTQ